MTDHQFDRLMKIGEVCDWLNVAHPTIYRWVADGKFPKPIKLGTSSRWRVSTIERFISEQEDDK